MIGLKIRIKHDDVAEKLAAVRGRLEDLEPILMGPVAEDVRATFAGVFATAGRFAVDGPWAPLAASTLRRKPGRSAVILVDTGEMFRAFTEAGASGSVARMIGPAAAEYGVEGLDRAELHQHGTARMPRRQIVPDEWPREDVERWSRLVGDWAVEAAT